MTRTYYRHVDDDQWYWSTEVTEPQTITTPWGDAQAEPGTLVMTAKGKPDYQFLVTPDDLETVWTTDDVPQPDPPGLAMEEPAPDPKSPVFPGDPQWKKDRGPEGPPSV